MVEMAVRDKDRGCIGEIIDRKAYYRSGVGRAG